MLTSSANHSSAVIAEPTRQLLLVEYYYVDVFVSSVALQALVERLTERKRSSVWSPHEFLSEEDEQDLYFIDHVRASSEKILAIARKLSDEGHLQNCPVRLFLRVVAASIFLLKAISLGVKEVDANESLHQLDRCIEALVVGRSQDVHLSARYADLLARHVSVFRRNLQAKRAAPGSKAQPVSTGGGCTGSNEQREHGRTTKADGAACIEASGTTPADASLRPPAPGSAGDGLGTDVSNWLAQPFDPQVAPFSLEADPSAFGLAMDSLDFLWYM